MTDITIRCSYGDGVKARWRGRGAGIKLPPLTRGSIMPRQAVILDAVSIVFLILLSLNSLLFFGLQGAPLERLLPGFLAEWSEAVFFVLLAIVTGATVHLLGSYKHAGAFLYVACLWAILAIGFVFGVIPDELTVQTIGWKILAFGYPPVYLYWIGKRKYRTYFKACAWVYTLAALGVFAQSLIMGVSALTGAAGPIPFVLTVFFVSVSIYLAWRLITVR